MRSIVGVWGSYHYGNFGDDLMAEVFSRELTRRGFDVVVFSENDSMFECDSNRRIVRDLDFGLLSSGALVVGGGAMLSRESLVRYLFRAASRNVEKEFRALNTELDRNRVRCIPLSIGGEINESGGIFGSRKYFFSKNSYRKGTVRLRTDIGLVKNSFNRNYSYVPDVLFTTADFYSAGKKNSDGLKVGVNLHKNKAQEVVRLLEEIVGHDSIFSIETHSSFYGGDYEWSGSEFRQVKYEVLDEFIKEISSFDVIVSDKLHLGLVASCFGVPFIPYKAKGKTLSVHQECGAESVVSKDVMTFRNVLIQFLERNSGIFLRDRIKDLGLSIQAAATFELMEEWVGEVV